MKKIIIIVVFLSFATLTSVSFAQTSKLGLTAYANYSNPTGGLSGWFKPSVNYGFGLGSVYNQDWYMEGLFEYSMFDDENMTSQSAGKVDLSLEHFGLVFNTKYYWLSSQTINPYLNFAVGLYYWKGIRGEIQPDNSVDPPIPYIEKRTLEEWNWGGRAGVGLEFKLSDSVALDLAAYYRLIIGDLWPAIQPGVELESVSGFQTLNLDLHLRYYF